MLKSTLLALLLGACASLTALQLWTAPANAGAVEHSAIRWAAQDIDTGQLKSTIEGTARRVQIANFGVVVLNLPVTPFESDSYPLLHLKFDELPGGVRTKLAWSEAAEGKITQHKLEVRTKKSQWIALSELKGWTGKIDTLTILLVAPPQSTIVIQEISLHPSGVAVQLQALASDWADFNSWGKASMNTNTGVTKLSPFYPVTVAAFLLLSSLAIHGSLALITRGRYQFSWSVVGLIFLFCWLLLDIPWQYQLLRQTDETRNIYAGKTWEEKLAVGPDAKLVAFTNAAKEKIESENARVFVASGDIYIGLRTAYYLYPLNVFWSIRGTELPYLKHLRKGDYVLMNRAKTMRINSNEDKLIMAHAHPPIEVLLGSGRNALVRLQ